MDGNEAALYHTHLPTFASLFQTLHHTHTHTRTHTLSHTRSPDRAAAVVMTLLSFTAAASPLCTMDQLSYRPRHHTHTHANGVPVLACLSNQRLIIMALKPS